MLRIFFGGIIMLLCVAPLRIGAMQNPRIEREKKDINKREKNGFTLLHGAAWMGNSELVRILLNVPGINPNATNNKGQTPLFFADDTETIKVLLNDQRTDVYVQDYRGKTAFAYAIECLRDEKAALLLRHCGPDVLVIQELDDACEADTDSTMVDIAINHINVRNENGLTPLHLATMENDFLEIKKLFEQSGINLNAVDNRGQTPLFFADDPEIVALFLSDDRVDVNVQDVKGRTLLLYALHCGHDEKAKFLLDHKNIDISIKNLKGQTALSIAVSNRDNQMIMLLLPKIQGLDELQQALATVLKEYDHGPCVEFLTNRIMETLKNSFMLPH